MNTWHIAPENHYQSKSTKQHAEKRKNLLISLIVPLALAVLSIPLHLFIIMKVIEWLQD